MSQKNNLNYFHGSYAEITIRLRILFFRFRRKETSENLPDKGHFKILSVTFVELPPQKDDLSRRMVLQPCSRAVLAAATPARPPPTTIT